MVRLDKPWAPTAHDVPMPAAVLMADFLTSIGADPCEPCVDKRRREQAHADDLGRTVIVAFARDGVAYSAEITEAEQVAAAKATEAARLRTRAEAA